MRTIGSRGSRRNRQQGNRQGVVAAAMILILGLYAAGTADAATCKDELDRFERRLHSSSLAETHPDTFRSLVRQAEEAGLLRDEQQCLETVAALNEAVPEDADTSAGKQTAPSRPAAPVLMMAGGDEADEPDEQQNTARSGAGDQDVDD